MKKVRRQLFLKSTVIAWSLTVLICLLGTSVFAQTIVDEWNAVKVPPEHLR